MKGSLIAFMFIFMGFLVVGATSSWRTAVGVVFIAFGFAGAILESTVQK